MPLEREGTSGANLHRISVELADNAEPFGRTLGLMLKLGGTGREVHFYNTAARSVPVETPSVLDARLLEDGTPWVLMVEISGMKDGLLWTAEEYRLVITDMARLHAHHWGRLHELTGLDWLEQPTPEHVQSLVNNVKENLAAVSASWLPSAMPEILSPERLELMHSALSQPNFLTPMLDLGCTIVHGDYWFHNVLITDDGRRVLVDWDGCTLWSGLWEFAYFLNLLHAVGPGVWREELPVSEQDAETWYLQALQGHGIDISKSDFDRGLAAARIWQPLAHWLRQLDIATKAKPGVPGDGVMRFMRTTFDRWEQELHGFRG